MDRTDENRHTRERADSRLAVQSAVARALSEATTASDAARRVLSSIGTTLGWRLGAVWEVAPGGAKLRCVESWQAPGAHDDAFLDASRSLSLQRGEGLPGRVWASGEAEWLRDVTVDSSFVRAGIAASAGVHGAFAFPIRSTRGVIGAVEFFTAAVAEPDRYLLDLMETIGHQLGLQLERTRAEEAVRHSEARKAAMLEASLDCIVSMDDRGRVLEFNAAAERTFGYSADEVVGREMAELIIPPALRDRHREGLRRYLETEERTVLGRRLEIVAMRADGSEFPVELAITRIALDGRRPSPASSATSARASGASSTIASWPRPARSSARRSTWTRRWRRSRGWPCRGSRTGARSTCSSRTAPSGASRRRTRTRNGPSWRSSSASAGRAGSRTRAASAA